MFVHGMVTYYLVIIITYQGEEDGSWLVTISQMIGIFRIIIAP